MPDTVTRRDTTPAAAGQAWVFALSLLCLLASHEPLTSQVVLIRVVDAGSEQPVVGAMAIALDGDGTTVRRTLTDDGGRALFVDLPAAEYRIRVEMIGMADAESDLFGVGPDSQVVRQLRLSARPIELAGLDVSTDGGQCFTRPSQQALLVARLWDEARKALTAAELTNERGAHRYETMRYEREIDRLSGAIIREDRAVQEAWMTTPYESHPAEELVQNGFVQQRGSEELFMAPDAAVLLSDPFLDTHCFHLAPAPAGGEGLIGLGFRPATDRRRVPDIAGTLWMDAQSGELRWLEYTYQHLEPERTDPDVGGRVDFQRTPAGHWIVPEWKIRMPIVSIRTDLQGRSLPSITGYKETGGIVLDIREGGGRRITSADRTGGIEGTVRDSLGLPVRGVSVGVVGSDQTVFTNAQGRFGIPRLPEGRYDVWVSHPPLDDAGFDPEPVRRDVLPGQMTSLDVLLPSRSEILFDQCGGEPRELETAILAGRVVDRRGQVVGGAAVTVTWKAYNFGGVVTGRRASDLNEVPFTTSTTTDALGRYRFCDVPTLVPLSLRATMPAVAGGTAESDDLPEPVQLTIASNAAVRVLSLATQR